MPGRYAIVCWVAVLRNDEETAQQAMKLLNFVVFGIAKGQAIVSVPGELDVGVEPTPAPEVKPVNAQPERLELREVTGPSALGGGWRRFGELLYLVSVTEFKKTYFGTVLGYLWSLLRPLFLFAVLLFVFTKIVRLGSGVPHYPVLLLMNVVLFGFFSESTTTSVMSVVNQESVVRKTQFPRLVIPLSVVMTALFNLGLNLIVVLIFILAFGVTPMWTWLLFPVILGLLFAFATGVSLLLSSLYVRFRDTAIIWSVLAVGALLRDAGDLSDRSRAEHLSRADHAQPAVADVRAGAQVDHRPERPGAGCRRGRLDSPDRADRALHRDLRPRRLVLQPRGAADRRGALGAPAGLLDEGVP